MHDIHIHTSLSKCAREDSGFHGYAAELSRRDVSVAGFADHLWDNDVPGASDWYRSQDIARLLPFRKELSGQRIPGVRLLFGCETEYIGNRIVGLTPEHAELFDYVLVPPHHFHMGGFVRPPQITGGKELTRLFITRFLEVCDIDFAFGIAHPFAPLGFMDRAQEVLSALSDSSLTECFSAAAERKKSIEVNLSILLKLSEAGGLEEYQRIMTLAARCGCKFHLGSDAHGLCQFGRERFLAGMDFAGKCGIVFPEDPFAEAGK